MNAFLQLNKPYLIIICLVIGFLFPIHHSFSQQYKKELSTGGITFGTSSTKKVQLLYTAADLGNPTSGVLSKLYFKKYPGSTTSISFTNFQIRVGVINNPSLQPGGTFETNLIPVFNYTFITYSVPVSDAFFSIDIDDIFHYNAGENLVIEYSYTATSTETFPVYWSEWPTASSTKQIQSTSATATSGTPTQAWLDFGIDLISTSPAPANDACTSATQINPTANFSKYTTDNIGSTQSLAPVNCSGSTSSAANDVWFKTYFYKAGDSLVVRGLSGFDPVVEIFTGSCANPVSAACSDNPQFSDAVEVIAPGNLVPLTQYWIRVYGWNGTKGTFEIAIKSDPLVNQIALDNCNTVGGLQSTTNYNFGTESNAFASQTYPPASCQGTVSTGQAYDVWFTFKCFQPNDSIIILPLLDFKPVVELYSQACNPGASVACAQNRFVPGGNVYLAPGNLIPGTQYYMRVYGWDGMQGHFKICVKRTPASSKANDECVNAIQLTPGTTCNSVSGTTVGANQSQIAACLVANNLEENDVWYKFVAQNSKDSVFVTPTSSFNPVVDLFSGCGIDYPFTCSNSQNANTVERVGGNLVVGQTYYVRIHGWTTINGTFNICVKSPIPVAAPPNDACSAPVTLSANTVCIPTTGTNTGATQSLTASLCGGATSSIANDVWYQFVASGATDSVIVDPSGTFDAVVEMFSGTCSALTSIGCVDNPNVGTATEKLSPGNLIPGQTYLIRVYGWNTSQGQFDICIKRNNCNSQAGTASSNVTKTVSNGSVLASLAGYAGTGSWFYTFDPGSGVWNSLSVFSPPDTFFLSGSVDDTVFIRAQVTTGNCVPAVSNAFSVEMRCATPITQKNGAASEVYVSGLQVGTSTNASTFDTYGGGFQNFNNTNWTFCRGNTYSFTITPSSSASLYKTAWVDFNNDGDFSDAGELVYGPTATIGSVNGSFQIPGSTSASSIRMRVMVFSAGANGVSSDPCFAGPYASGEIEEHTLYLFNAPSTANAGPDQTVCSASATLAATAPASGTGSWSLVSGSGTIANPAQANSGVSNLGTGANVFRWTVTSACSTSQALVTITKVLAPSSNAGTDQSVCESAAILSGNNPGGNTTGQWTIAAGTGNFANANSASTTVSNLSNGINRFVWTLTTPGCGQTKDTVQVTKFPTPTTPNAGNDQSVCSSSAQLSGNQIVIGYGLWTVVSGSGTFVNSSSNTTIVNGLSSGPNVFRWSSTIGNCPALTDEVTINATPVVQANAGNNQILCASQTTLSGNNPGSGTGIWTLLSGSGTLQNPTSSNTILSNIGIGENKLIWSISNGNCPGTSDTVIVSRIPAQTANAGPDQSVCGGQATLSATVPATGSGVWSLVSGTATIVNPSDPNTQITNIGTGIVVLRWSINNPPCPQVSDEVSINNLGNVTIAQAGADQIICSSQTTITGNTATIGNGNWTLISGSGNINSPNNPIITVTNLGVGLNVFRWSITNGNCPPSFDDVTIERTASPSVANAGADQNICANTTQFSANTPGSGLGVWTLISGSGLIANPQSPVTSVSGLGNGTNVFRWTVTNDPCPASTDEVSIITTGNAVTSNAGQDQVVCGETTSLSANNAGAGTGTWTVVSGAGIFANPNAPNSSVSGISVGVNQYRWTIITGACPASTDDVEVTRTDATSAANAGADQSICTSTTTLAATNPQNGTGIWTLISGTGTITDPTLPASTVTGLGNGVNTFRWTVSNLPCGSTSDDVSISTNLSAITANAGSDQTICGNVAQLSGNNPGNGTGIWTLVSGSGNITNPNGATTSVTGLSQGANVFRWKITSGVCTPSEDEVTLTSVSNPVAANAGNDQSICGTSASLSANLPGQGTGKWSLVSGSGQIANPDDPATTVFNLGNGNNVFRWTISNLPCTPSFDDITINATSGNVTAQAGPDKTVCGSTIFLNATAPVTGFGSWALVSGSGTITQPGNPVSEVTNLGEGVNTFSWTVTSGNCTASDIVSVTKEINTLNLGPDTLVCVGSTYNLQAGNGFAGYLWFDGSSQPFLTVGASGNYSVQVTTSNNCVFRDTAKVTFVICTDVQALIEEDESLIFFPNPAENQLFWQWKPEKQISVQIRLINSLGEIVWSEQITKPTNDLNEIRLPKMASGLYLIEWETDKTRISRKVVIR